MPEEIILSMLASDTDFVVITPEFKAKTSREVHNSLELLPSFERTYIIVVARHKDKGRNYLNRISCKKGLPIGGYVFDSQSESYHVECADYLHLGHIPISFVAKIKGLEHWEMRVPAPEAVLKKYLSALQKKELKNFKTHFKDHDFQYIQMIDPN